MLDHVTRNHPASSHTIPPPYFHDPAVASKRCNNVTIQNNQVWRNSNAGIMLHRSSDYGVISGNVVYKNGDAGVALFETFYTEIYDNTLWANKCKCCTALCCAVLRYPVVWCTRGGKQKLNTSIYLPMSVCMYVY